MTDRFVALPVGQGDAFFLQRGSFAALIDGGRARNAFPGMFHQTLNRKGLDVLVCTHNDADHAEGILGFLESGLGCEEVWLPAQWRHRLDDLLTDTANFRNELVSNIRDRRFEPPVMLDQIGDSIAADPLRPDQAKPDDDESAALEVRRAPEPLPPSDENDEGNSAFVWLKGVRHTGVSPEWNFGHDNDDHWRWHVFDQALAAAIRIRDIARACMDRGVPVRWFRHSSDYARSGRDELRPLNANEIGRARIFRPRAFDYIALSTSNKCSLTFCSPRQGDFPGVIFTADSDLAFPSPIPWEEGMIVTTPHHGSEANKRAYQRFSAETGDKIEVVWVRSDGNFKSRPGPSYRGQTRRFCTLCRPSNRTKQIVKFTVKYGSWAPVATRSCHCR